MFGVEKRIYSLGYSSAICLCCSIAAAKLVDWWGGVRRAERTRWSVGEENEVRVSVGKRDKRASQVYLLDRNKWEDKQDLNNQILIYELCL